MSVGSPAWHARDIPVLVGAAVTESEIAYAHLAAHDPVMRHLVRRFGRPDPFGWDEEAGLGDNFSALVRYSALSQCGGSSTSVVYTGIRRATQGFSSAAKVADLGADRLTALGLPAADAGRLVRLAWAQLAGDVELEMLVGRNDHQVRGILKGYGFSRLVTDLFLIRRLHRPDVMPAGDPAIASVAGRVGACGDVGVYFGLQWAPFRTYAAALLRALSRATTSAVEQDRDDR